MAKKSEVVRQSHLFDCLLCQEAKELELSDWKRHRAEAHDLPAEGLKGRRKLQLHLDGDTWWSSTYLIESETGKHLAMEYVTMPRRGRDREMWAHSG